MHIHLHFHASYYVDSNSVSVDTSVAMFDSDGEYLTQEIKVLHDDHREIMWEEGKGISVACAAQKALSRFTETCENYASPF